ncbi:MAG: hypothetical protein J1E40_02905 [Oscillospiraceae bacterium]|nr:hypothetical protein [Oscillospiraceae bacterium]
MKNIIIAKIMKGIPARTPIGAGSSSLAEPISAIQTARGILAAALIAP